MKLEIDRRWLLASAVGVVALLVLTIVAWQIKSIDIPLLGEGGSAPRAEAQAHNDLDDESMPGLSLQGCVDLWNGSLNASGRSSLSALLASYVSVTFSDLYPGKCLVTAANSELNLSAQFLEGDGNPSAFDQVGSGAATSLPPSVTDWNASSDERGYIGLGG